MHKVVVSVLMPVYNGEKYLREAIDSVLHQTYRHFEFLILNDGSTDQTQKIIESYSDERIKAFQHKNMGVARSLNRGLELATGSYIWRHDADDKSLPDQLQIQIDFLERNKGFSLVSTQIAFMTHRGKIAHAFKQPKDSFFNNTNYVKVTRAQFNPYSPITHATVLVKRDVFDKIGTYRTEFKTSEDTDLWLRIIEKFDAAVLNYCPYYVRLNPTSATQVYRQTNTFYRNLAFKMADQREKSGKDLIELGEELPVPKKQIVDNNYILQPKGKNYRSDVLDFKYKVAINAKDFQETLKLIRIALVDGWMLKQTWKTIVFQLLGKKLVNLGVKLKKKLR